MCHRGIGGTIVDVESVDATRIIDAGRIAFVRQLPGPDGVREAWCELHIDRVIWLDDVIEKIERKHSVESSEVWEVLQSKPKFRFVEKGHREGEDVYAALGRTDAGRYLGPGK